MEHLEPTEEKRVRPAKWRHPLVMILVLLDVKPWHLAQMLAGVVPQEVAQGWWDGGEISAQHIPLVRKAAQTFLSDAEALLGQAAVRDPLFAKSKKFLEFATRINRTRKQLDGLGD